MLESERIYLKPYARVPYYDYYTVACENDSTSPIYDFYGENKKVFSTTGWGMPPVDYVNAKSPQMHGELTSSFRLQPRPIDISYRVNGCSRLDFWRNRQEIIKALNITSFKNGAYDLWGSDNISYNQLAYQLGVGPLQYGPNQLVYEIDGFGTFAADVFYNDGFTFPPRNTEEWDEWGVDETIQFISPSGYLYDPNMRTHVFENVYDSTVPVPVPAPDPEPVFYNGTWISYPLIEIEHIDDNNTSVEGDYVGAIVLEILSPAYSRFQVNYAPTANKKIMIDFRHGFKKIFLADKAFPLNLPAVDITSKALPESWRSIGNFYVGPFNTQSYCIAGDPGGTKAFRVYSVPGTRVTMKYFETYVGI